jgi:hypothetical protein
MPKRALPDCLRKNKKDRSKDDGPDLYKPGAGVLAPREATDGVYAAGSQKHFLKRRSGKPMSERASRLAQMQAGPGYSRGQKQTAKAKAVAIDNAKKKARQPHGGGRIVSNSRPYDQGAPVANSRPYDSPPPRGNRHRNNEISPTNDFSVNGRRTDPLEGERAGDLASGLKAQVDAANSKVNRLSDEEQDLLDALRDIQDRKSQAEAELRDRQEAYHAVLLGVN